MSPKTILIATALCGLIATPLAAQEMKGMDHSKMTMPAKASPSTKAFQDVDAKMHKNMTIDYSGNPDADFVRSMIPHHQGAIDMAKVELQYGQDPQLRKLAEGIVKAQEGEIAEMQAWLKAHGK